MKWTFSMDNKDLGLDTAGETAFVLEIQLDELKARLAGQAVRTHLGISQAVTGLVRCTRVSVKVP